MHRKRALACHIFFVVATRPTRSEWMDAMRVCSPKSVWMKMKRFAILKEDGRMEQETTLIKVYSNDGRK